MPMDLSQHALSTLAEQDSVDMQDSNTSREASDEEADILSENGEEDEDEVDKSLSLVLKSPARPHYSFSPAKVAQFATPQPASKSRSARRASLPSAIAAAVPALVSLQINGSGERILVSSTATVPAAAPLPTKSKKLIRVSDVGLPSSEVSMGYDLVPQADSQQEGVQIAEALNNLFSAEHDEMTDDEEEDESIHDHQSLEDQAIGTEPQDHPLKLLVPAAEPETPVALASLRHIFSVPTVSATPDMRGMGQLLGESPQKPSAGTPQYGTLYDRMRSNPEMAQLMSSSPSKASLSSPRKPRSSVRRSPAAESPAPPSSAVAQPLPCTPRPAFEAELHVTLIDTTLIDAQNENPSARTGVTHDTRSIEGGNDPEDGRETVEVSPSDEQGEHDDVQATVVATEIEQPTLQERTEETPAEVITESEAKQVALDVASSPTKTKKETQKVDVTGSEAENTASSPAKSTRGRKQRTATSVATITEQKLTVEESPAGKKTRATRGKKTKDALEVTEDESATATEEKEHPVNVAVASSPVKSTRARARAAVAPTRATTRAQVPSITEAAPAPAPRSTRSRRAKTAILEDVAPSSDRPEMPSSSAGFGDDEASDHDDVIHTNAKAQVEQTRDAAALNTTASNTKRTSRARKGATVATAVADDDDLVHAPSSSPTKSIAATTRKTRTKAAEPPKAKSAQSRQVETNNEDDSTAASSASTTTTRSGRPRRAAAQK